MFQVDAADGSRPATVFGRRSDDESILSSTAGEPLGQILGVVGSAFCASVERYEGELSWSDQTAKIMRTFFKRNVILFLMLRPSTSEPSSLFGEGEKKNPLFDIDGRPWLVGAFADPAHGDPGAPLLRPASFSVPHPLGVDAFAYLGDAGFSCNSPLPALVVKHRPKYDALVYLDASAYPPDPLARRKAVKRECARLAAALARPGGLTEDDIRIDVDAYVSKPLSYHTIATDTDNTTLLIILTLIRDDESLSDDDDDDDAALDASFDPLANAHSGGFCASRSASYDPADYDKLVTFVRRRLRRHLPAIRSKIHQHRQQNAA